MHKSTISNYSLLHSHLYASVVFPRRIIFHVPGIEECFHLTVIYLGNTADSLAIQKFLVVKYCRLGIADIFVNIFGKQADIGRFPCQLHRQTAESRVTAKNITQTQCAVYITECCTYKSSKSLMKPDEENCTHILIVMAEVWMSLEQS